MNETPPSYVIEAARQAAMRSPCEKSKRGVALFNRESADRVASNWHGPALTPQAYPIIVNEVVVATGFNGQPPGFACSNTYACRRDCAKLCMHAEQRAIMAAGALDDLQQLELVHVKVVDGIAVPSGGPSCWQCSRLIVEVKLRGVWLFESGTRYPEAPPEWRFYESSEFHRETLRSCDLGDQS